MEELPAVSNQCHSSEVTVKISTGMMIMVVRTKVARKILPPVREQKNSLSFCPISPRANDHSIRDSSGPGNLVRQKKLAQEKVNIVSSQSCRRPGYQRLISIDSKGLMD